MDELAKSTLHSLDMLQGLRELVLRSCKAIDHFIAATPVINVPAGARQAGSRRAETRQSHVVHISATARGKGASVELYSILLYRTMLRMGSDL